LARRDRLDVLLVVGQSAINPIEPCRRDVANSGGQSRLTTPSLRSRLPITGSSNPVGLRAAENTKLFSDFAMRCPRNWVTQGRFGGDQLRRGFASQRKPQRGAMAAVRRIVLDVHVLPRLGSGLRFHRHVSDGMRAGSSPCSW
jgi:hypothetical protein